MPTDKHATKLRVRDFSLHIRWHLVCMISLHSFMIKNCMCVLYNRIYPETFNGLLYCCSSAHRKECFINANFRLNSSARKGMMFVSKVQHFTLININKMVVTLIGEQFFVRILFFYLFFFLFFSFLCALLCFALLCCTHCFVRCYSCVA